MSKKNNVISEGYSSDLISFKATKSADKIITDEPNMLGSRWKGWDFKSVRVDGTDGDLLLILDEFKFVIIDPEADCNDFGTLSCYVQTTGWQATFPPRFPFYLNLYNEDKNPIWQVATYVESRCKYNFRFAVEEEIPFDAYNEAQYANYGWPKTEFVRCD